MVPLYTVTHTKKIDNRTVATEQQKAEFQPELCTNGKHVIVKISNLLLKFEMREE